MGKIRIFFFFLIFPNSTVAMIASGTDDETQTRGLLPKSFLNSDGKATTKQKIVMWCCMPCCLILLISIIAVLVCWLTVDLSTQAGPAIEAMGGESYVAF